MIKITVCDIFSLIDIKLNILENLWKNQRIYHFKYTIHECPRCHCNSLVVIESNTIIYNCIFCAYRKIEYIYYFRFNFEYAAAFDFFERSVKICRNCKGLIKSKKYFRKYCSKKCHDEFMQFYNKYLSFGLQKHKCLERFSIGDYRYRCIMCKEVFTYDQIHVHHLVPIADYGNPIDQLNLVVVCHECHWKFHRMWNRMRDKRNPYETIFLNKNNEICYINGKLTKQTKLTDFLGG